MRRLGKFLRLPSSDRRLFVEAAICLGVARLAVLVLPFRWIAPFLGRHMDESPQTTESEHKEIGVRISWAVQTASRHMPWECKCLTQAIAGKGMFKLRGVRSTLYLGVARDDGEKLRAHAWLRSGDVFVTGGHRTNQFVVVSSFREKER
jgi:hypothetical protein